MKNMELFSVRHFWGQFLFFFLASVPLLIVSANKCRGGQDIFTTVMENSPRGQFIANFTITGDLTSNHINLSLGGPAADWLFLDGKQIRLNSSDTRVLDREVYGTILLATVKCYENKILQSESRIAVKILNENDNKPEFVQSTIQDVVINELTAVNSVAFTVHARDADGDPLVYSIDKMSPDASYFRVDLPNNGQITLNKSLNYETKTQLKLHLFAVEMNTMERYITTATLTINVIDADDQYPQFQPCILLSINQSSRICVNPLYTVNITEKDEDIILDFSPGPVCAVDGDTALRTPLIYTIMSGADNGRFVINSESGEMKLTRRVENRLLTPTLRLRIMAAQKDDPMKYSVATALVRVLAENQFPPQFSRSTYRGFVFKTSDPVSLVLSYGNEPLMLKAIDQDFTDGINPKLQFSLRQNSSISQLYYITQEGLLIGKTNHLLPNYRHTLEVLAIDQESGDVVKAVIDIEVLQKGQTVPQGPLEEKSERDRKTEIAAGAGLASLAIALLLIVCFIKRRRVRPNPAERAGIADNKHPNVTLRWFQLQVNRRRSLPLVEEASFYYEAFGGYDASTSTLYGKQGLYTKIDQQREASQSSQINPPVYTLNMTKCTSPAVWTTDTCKHKSVMLQDMVMEEGFKQEENDAVDSQMEEFKNMTPAQFKTERQIDLSAATMDQAGENIVTEKFPLNDHTDSVMRTGHERTKVQTEQGAKDEIINMGHLFRMKRHTQHHEQRCS